MNKVLLLTESESDAQILYASISAGLWNMSPDKRKWLVDTFALTETVDFDLQFRVGSFRLRDVIDTVISSNAFVKLSDTGESIWEGILQDAPEMYLCRYIEPITVTQVDSVASIIIKLK